MRMGVVAALIAVIAPALGAAVIPPRMLEGTGLTGPVGLRSEPSVTQSAQTTVTRGEWTADTRNTWRDNDNETRVQFNLRTSAGDSRWGFGARLRDLAGLPPAAFSSVANDVQFSWTREAGTFRFNGSFDTAAAAARSPSRPIRRSSTTWPAPATRTLLPMTSCAWR